MKTLTLLATLLFAPVVLAQSPSAPSTTPSASTTSTTTTTTTTPSDAKPSAKPAKLAKSDLQVLAYYKALNDMEIDLGKTAARLGTSQGVKDYGKMLVTEHTASNKKLMTMAKQRAQKIPAVKPMTSVEKQEKADAKAAVMKLKKLKGAEFDTAFVAQMIVDHEREIVKADTKLAEVKDTELAEMIRATKPVLQHHADRARELQSGATQVSTGAKQPGASATTTTTGAARTSGTTTRTSGQGGTQGTSSTPSTKTGSSPSGSPGASTGSSSGTTQPRK